MQSPPSFATVSRLKQRYGDPDLAVPMEEIDTSRTLLDLDDDLLIHIAEYLPPHRVLAIAQTCNRWSELIGTSELRERAFVVLDDHEEFFQERHPDETRPEWLAFYAAQNLVWNHASIDMSERRKAFNFYLGAKLDKELQGDACNDEIYRLRGEYDGLDNVAVQPYIDIVRRYNAPFKFLVGAPKPTVEIADFHQSNKAAYFKVHLSTAGGTTFTLDGRWGGHGLDPMDLEDEFFEAHPELFNEDYYDNPDADYLETKEFQDFVDKAAKANKEGFEEEVRWEAKFRFFNAEMMEDPSLKLDITVKDYGPDFVPVEKTAVGFDYPTFEW